MQELKWGRFRGTKIGLVADIWSLRGFINNSGGFFDEACDAATRGLEIDEKHVNSLHVRGYALVQLGQNADAAIDLERALALTREPPKRDQISRLLETVRTRTASE